MQPGYKLTNLGFEGDKDFQYALTPHDLSMPCENHWQGERALLAAAPSKLLSVLTARRFPQNRCMYGAGYAIRPFLCRVASLPFAPLILTLRTGGIHSEPHKTCCRPSSVPATPACASVMFGLAS